MKTVILSALAFAVWATVFALHAIDVEGNKLIFSEQEMAFCRAENGCKVITMDRFNELEKAATRCDRSRT